MRQIVASTPEHLAHLCQKVEYFPTTNFRGITLLVDGIPRIVVGYDCWTDGAVAMHQWIDHPKYMGRDILREAFRFPFEIGDRQVAVATVRSDNERALELDLKLGFREVGIIKDAYGPGVDMHILQLRRDECRWYRYDNGKSDQSLHESVGFRRSPEACGTSSGNSGWRNHSGEFPESAGYAAQSAA